MLALFLLIGLSSCDALLSASNGNAAWSFDFSGTQWDKTEQDEFITLKTRTFSDLNVELTVAESTVNITEKYNSFVIQKPALGEDVGTWTFTMVTRFNDTFAGPYTDVPDDSSNFVTAYTGFGGGISIEDGASVDLNVSRDISYVGFGGQVLTRGVMTGTWQSYKNSAGEISYMITSATMTTTQFKYNLLVEGAVTTLVSMDSHYEEVLNFDPHLDTSMDYVSPVSGYAVSGSGADAIIDKLVIQGLDFVGYTAAELVE